MLFQIRRLGMLPVLRLDNTAWVLVISIKLDSTVYVVVTAKME